MNSMADRIDDAAQRLDEAGTRTGSAMRRELSDFFDDVEELIARATHTKDEDIARIRSKVEASLSNARDSAGRMAKRVQRGVGDAARSTDEFVHDQPWTMMGVAALIGLAVGVALGRR